MINNKKILFISGPTASGKSEIAIRQTKYLNNIVEQDHRGIKRIYKPMLGFKEFHCAQKVLRGIEAVRMIKKGQLSHSSDSEIPFHIFCRIAA